MEPDQRFSASFRPSLRREPSYEPSLDFTRRPDSDGEKELQSGRRGFPAADRVQAALTIGRGRCDSAVPMVSSGASVRCRAHHFRRC